MEIHLTVFPEKYERPQKLSEHTPGQLYDHFKNLNFFVYYSIAVIPNTATTLIVKWLNL